MINPPHHHHLPAKRVGPTVCLIKPKGRDRAGHTAREAGRNRGGRKNLFFLSSPLFWAAIRLQDMTAQSWLPCPCLSSFSCLSISVHFLPLMRKCLQLYLSRSLFVAFPCTLTPQSAVTKLQIHRTSSLKQRSDYCFSLFPAPFPGFLHVPFHFLDSPLNLTYD